MKTETASPVPPASALHAASPGSPHRTSPGRQPGRFPARPPAIFTTAPLVAGVIALSALALTALPRPAVAAEDPIPHIDVVVEKVPPGNGFQASTDAQGFLSFRSLPAGNYFVRDGKGNSARIRHRGGAARWQLLAVKRGLRTAWTLRNASDPL